MEKIITELKNSLTDDQFLEFYEKIKQQVELIKNVNCTMKCSSLFVIMITNKLLHFIVQFTTFKKFKAK